MCLRVCLGSVWLGCVSLRVFLRARLRVCSMGEEGAYVRAYVCAWRVPPRRAGEGGWGCLISPEKARLPCDVAA